MARTQATISYSRDASYSLKDAIFNHSSVSRLAADIQSVYPSFDTTQFIDRVLVDLFQLELKQRVHHIVDCLYTYLPQDFPQALDIILQALPAPLDPEKTDGDFGDFVYEPYNQYIARYGCTAAHLQRSLCALEQTTQRFSAEFAIRYFITQFPQQTLEQMHIWSQHSNYHVRRLSCEGTRPNLPWGGKLHLAPAQRLPILHRLHADPTRYVTRSVANHLNDLSKTDLPLVLDMLQQWKTLQQQTPAELLWMTKHALRTAIRQGNADALRLLGYDPHMRCNLDQIEYSSRVAIGDDLHVSLHWTAQQSGQYMIDYVVYFLKQDGSHSTKTFKITNQYLTAGQTTTLAVKRSFRVMSTRLLYTGTHYWALQINGHVYTKHSFVLHA